jgi:RND superfamily putative drug exporter
MEIMGRWNWWLPKWLDRILPHTSFEGGGDTDEPGGDSGEPAPPSGRKASPSAATV